MTTHTDRELLELAAKAAGIKVDYSRFNGGGTKNTGFDLAGNAVLDWHNYKTWNPLTDDGDALRLAVNLNLHVYRYGSMTTVKVCSSLYAFDERDDGDSYAATRRAIVRAAASIGGLTP